MDEQEENQAKEAYNNITKYVNKIASDLLGEMIQVEKFIRYIYKDYGGKYEDELLLSYELNQLPNVYANPSFDVVVVYASMGGSRKYIASVDVEELFSTNDHPMAVITDFYDLAYNDTDLFDLEEGVQQIDAIIEEMHERGF